MVTRLRRYRPEMPHSYALGVSPTIELLTRRPNDVTEVIVCATWERNEGIRWIMDRCRERGIEVIVSDRTLNRVSGQTHCWAAGVFRKFGAPLDPAANHVVLVSPDDMGNVGTTIRTMLALGTPDLAVVGPACDVFDPRVVRASAGAIFQARFEGFGSFEEHLQRFPRHVYCLMSDGRAALPDVRFEEPWALVLGNEGAGLPARFHDLGTSVRIPQSDAVDSLNLSVAAAIALYAATRRA
jgi:TrmH family RNA methyltransferase